MGTIDTLVGVSGVIFPISVSDAILVDNKTLTVAYNSLVSSINSLTTLNMLLQDQINYLSATIYNLQKSGTIISGVVPEESGTITSGVVPEESGTITSGVIPEESGTIIYEDNILRFINNTDSNIIYDSETKTLTLISNND